MRTYYRYFFGTLLVFLSYTTNAQCDVFSINIDQELSSCFNSELLFLTVTPTGGIPDYTYQILNEDGNVLESITTSNPEYFFQFTFETLAGPGLYTINVIDGNGCVAQETIDIQTSYFPLEISVQGAACLGGSSSFTIDTSFIFTPVDYKVFSSPGNEVIREGFNQMLPITVDDMQAGDYYVEITDFICFELYDVTIPLSNPFFFITSVESPFCFGDSSGSITVQYDGGGTPPFTYNLYNSANELLISSMNTVFNGLSAGVYNVEIVDGNNCGYIEYVEILETEPLSQDITIVYNNPSNNTVQIIGSAGTEPYSYQLSGPNITTQENTNGIFNDIPEGDYTARIQDSNGCITETPVKISYVDANLDGIPDNDEDVNANGVLTDDDTDGDGIPDYLDDDDDNDGVNSINEVVANKIFSVKGGENFIDTDGDKIPNHRDTDDDDDGILTIDEDYNGNGDPTDDDTDGSGIADYLEKDVFILSTNNTTTNNSFSLYPIPADRYLEVSPKNDFGIIHKLSLYNVLGTRVLDFWNKEAQKIVSVDITSFPSGVYFATIENQLGKTGTRQIVIK